MIIPGLTQLNNVEIAFKQSRGLLESGSNTSIPRDSSDPSALGIKRGGAPGVNNPFIILIRETPLPSFKAKRIASLVTSPVSFGSIIPITLSFKDSIIFSAVSALSRVLSNSFLNASHCNLVSAVSEVFDFFSH